MAQKLRQRSLEWTIIICFYLNIAVGTGFFEGSKWILGNDTQGLCRIDVFQIGGDNSTLY